jgi:hypothetical protein
LTLYETEIFNKRTHQIFNINITLKLKGNVLRMVFLGIFYLAGMIPVDISGEFNVQLYWVRECGVGG